MQVVVGMRTWRLQMRPAVLLLAAAAGLPQERKQTACGFAGPHPPLPSVEMHETVFSSIADCKRTRDCNTRL